MPTSIQRKYYVTTFDELSTIPIVEGNVITLSDTDGLYYDVGNPAGSGQSIVRRKASAIEYVETLADARHERDTIFVITEGNATTGYCWNEDNNSFYPVFNNAEVTDSKVQSVKQSPWNTKAYIVASEQEGTWTGNLLKNPNIYITSTGKIHADIEGSATSTSFANSANSASTANKATKDGDNNTITDYYLHDVSSNATTDLGSTLTFTFGNGDLKAVRVSDHTYSLFTASSSGLVPAASGGTLADLVLTGSGWEDIANVSIGNATNATNATNDADGNEIAATYYADVSYTTGVGLTLTSSDGNTHKTVQLPISDYDVFAPDVNGLVPAPTQVQSEQDLFLKSDGTWDVSTTNDFVPATSEEAGIHGLVPAPEIGVDASYFLRGDKSWGSQFNTTYYGLVPPPLIADPSYSLRADGSWAQSSSTDTKNTTGASQVEYGINHQDEFTGDGTTASFTLLETANQITEVTIDDVATSDYTFNDSSNTITFTEAPANESVILVNYISPETEILYLIGAKVQDGGNDSPVTYSNNKFYILNDALYSNGNEVIDTTSQQDMVNKTFNGNALGSSAFVQASESVTLTQVTISDTFTGDGETVDFTTNNQALELDEVSVNEEVKTIDVDYTFDIATSTVTFMVAPLAPHYDLLTSEPSNWSTDYASYFTKDENDQYINVEGVATYTTNVESDWDLIGNNIWEYEDNTYTQIFTKPDNWDTNYGDYFTRSFVAPTFAVDTYYELISEDIVITYLANDPDYDTGNVPTNSAVISYTNSRMSSVQQDLARRIATQVAASTYNEIQIDTFTGDGATVTFTLSKQASGISEVTIAGTATTDYTFNSTNNQVTFTVAPGNGTAISISYTLKYDVGDYVMYFNGETTLLYRCNTPITSKEVFTPAHWDSVLLTDLPNCCYTSSEKLVGTWIDNSDLYEQTITISNLVAAASQAVAHSISADKIFVVGGFTEYTVSNHKYYGMLSAYDATASTEELRVRVDDTNIVYMAGNDLSGATAYVTVRYTKPQT